MAKLKDIAKLTNTSVSTVSRVLNDDSSLKLSSEKVVAIKKTANELGYKVRAKAHGNYKVLLFSWYDSYQELVDPYYLSIRVSIEEFCKEQNINLTVVHRSDINVEQVEYDYNGILCVGKFTREEALIFEQINKNIVFVDSNPAHERYIGVISDLYKTTMISLEEIYNLNHREITFINGVESLSDGEVIISERLRSYLDFCEKKKIKVDVIDTNFSFEGGKDVASKIKTTTTCVLCASDAIAIGLLGNINPEVSIVGIDDILVSKYVNPSLTTSRINTHLIGREAIKQLLNLINGEEYIAKNITIPTKFIKRDSLKERINYEH